MSVKIVGGPEPKGGGGGQSNPLFTIIELMRQFFAYVQNKLNRPVPVYLPENVFNPEGSETFDLMRLQITNAGARETVLEYKATELQTIRFTRYGLFNNKVLATELRFYPTINGKRILPFHGDPLDNFAIYLSVGVDLSEAALIPCDVTLLPGQVLKWEVENLSGASAEFGVRMRGYIVNQNKKLKSGG